MTTILREEVEPLFVITYRKKNPHLNDKAAKARFEHELEAIGDRQQEWFAEIQAEYTQMETERIAQEEKKRLEDEEQVRKLSYEKAKKEEVEPLFLELYKHDNPRLSEKAAKANFDYEFELNKHRLDEWCHEVQTKYARMEDTRQEEKRLKEELESELEAQKIKDEKTATTKKKKAKAFRIFASLALILIISGAIWAVVNHQQKQEGSRRVDAALKAQRQHGRNGFLCLVPTTKGGAFPWGPNDPTPLTADEYAEFFVRANEEGLLNLAPLSEAQNALAAGDSTVIAKNLEATLLAFAAAGEIKNGSWIVKEGETAKFTIPLGSSGLVNRLHIRLTDGTTVIGQTRIGKSDSVPPELVGLVNDGCQTNRYGGNSLSAARNLIKAQILEGIAKARARIQNKP